MPKRNLSPRMEAVHDAYLNKVARAVRKQFREAFDQLADGEQCRFQARLENGAIDWAALIRGELNRSDDGKTIVKS